MLPPKALGAADLLRALNVLMSPSTSKRAPEPTECPSLFAEGFLPFLHHSNLYTSTTAGGTALTCQSPVGTSDRTPIASGIHFQLGFHLRVLWVVFRHPAAWASSRNSISGVSMKTHGVFQDILQVMLTPTPGWQRMAPMTKSRHCGRSTPRLSVIHL